ncbi:MAG TPA: YdcF family protein [Verrucomicrobiae bacterium]|nr:YdcF family protein [Verrucomicrobiae bacterium]
MEVDKNAKIIWDFMQMNMTLQKSNAIFALCSHDIRVAERTLNLYRDRYASWVIISGGAGRLTKNMFSKPESEVFKDILVNGGIPESKIIVEPKASNTGENVRFTFDLLSSSGMDFDSFILVQKPYMERRTYATFKKQWPNPRTQIFVTSPKLSYEEYVNGGILSKDEIISLMVGDTQRIREYPKMGFQIEQDIPKPVWNAYESLITAGYTKHLLQT